MSQKEYIFRLFICTGKIEVLLLRPPRNIEKLKILQKELRKLELVKNAHNMKRSKLSTKMDNVKERSVRVTRKIIELEGEEDTLQKEIGRIKGLHCVAKYENKSFQGYYNCYCKKESSMVLRNFYYLLCYPCKISQKHIVIRTFMERLGGVKKDEEM